MGMVSQLGMPSGLRSEREFIQHVCFEEVHDVSYAPDFFYLMLFV
jgi:hypothetical protein